MRRLYSTFATGLPGVGLLIMRLVAGTVLVFRGVEGLLGEIVVECYAKKLPDCGRTRTDPTTRTIGGPDCCW